MSEHPVLCHITQLPAQVYGLCQCQSLSVSVSKLILFSFCAPEMYSISSSKHFPLRCTSKPLSHSHFSSTSKRRINAEPLTFTCTTSSSWFYHVFLFLPLLSFSHPQTYIFFSFKEVFVLICCSSCVLAFNCSVTFNIDFLLLKFSLVGRVYSEMATDIGGK